MPNDYWPLADLQLRTKRLTLLVPTGAQLLEVAAVAARGVHRPGEHPFLTPWTELPAEQRARHVLQQHWSRAGAWSPQRWALEFAVYRQDEPLGMAVLKATDFAVTREVKTESWLGLEHQGQGYGTEARSALLHLAFTGLGAEYALTEVFRDNAASQAVSKKLGYRKDGISRDVLHGQAVISDRLRLAAAGFAAVDAPAASIHGLVQCLPFFLGPQDPASA
ncbi:hypothetical protein AUR04nite_16520 [Glutamicibacter uratoxydans]|uniref:N-acetyltransferase domain-containing protein n=1 Tax=Glutamicibacter uratoxydans TaxID=43667 RepID=A0A4Y4DRG1_GLUUR|nr:GNAT family protein [Glutamicibacter uratoxydans]GED06120.1 hypothetical protein AUR04nite_16520 [Glutamicibacter uratoxydans]